MDRALVCLGDDNVIDIFPVKLNWNNSKICSSTKDFICSRLAWLVVPFKGYLMISAEPSWSSHFSFFVRQAFFNGFHTLPEFATLRLFAAWAKCVFDAFNLKETEKKIFLPHTHHRIPNQQKVWCCLYLIFVMLNSRGTLPAQSFFGLLDCCPRERLCLNRIWSLLSMPCMLLGYISEPRPNSRALGSTGSVMTIGLSINECLHS